MRQIRLQFSSDRGRIRGRLITSTFGSGLGPIAGRENWSEGSGRHLNAVVDAVPLRRKDSQTIENIVAAERVATSDIQLQMRGLDVDESLPVVCIPLVGHGLVNRRHECLEKGVFDDEGVVLLDSSLIMDIQTRQYDRGHVYSLAHWRPRRSRR